jgi:hypothetical protein
LPDPNLALNDGHPRAFLFGVDDKDRTYYRHRHVLRLHIQALSGALPGGIHNNVALPEVNSDAVIRRFQPKLGF